MDYRAEILKMLEKVNNEYILKRVYKLLEYLYINKIESSN